MSQESEEFEEHVPTKIKIGYSCANAANSMLSGLGLSQIVFFYTIHLGLDATLQGNAWLIFAAWNAINDPLIGIFQDKTKSKLGRRVPYLRYGAPIYSVLFILIWFPFASSSNQPLLFFNYLLMLFLFDTLFSMIGLVTYSLPAEMAITAGERSNIVVFSTVFGIGAQVLGIVLPIFFLKEDSSIFVWQMLMILVAVIAGIVLYVSSYFIKENKWAQKEETLGFFESIKETLKNKQFLVLEVAIFALNIISTVVLSGIMFLFSVIEFDNWLYAIPAVAGLIIAVLLFNKYIPKVGVKKVVMVGMTLGAIGFLLIPFFGRKLSSFYIPLTLVLVGFSTIIIGNQPLMADAIDYDEMRTGKRRETTYSGVNALIVKPAISIANWLFLFILKKFGYITPTESNPDPLQPATVADGIILAYTIIPAICAIISVISLIFFKLDGPEWLEKKKDLQRIHAKKEKEYVESLRKEGKL